MLLLALAQAPLVVDALLLLADRMPQLVLPFLQQTEATLTHTLKAFRTTFEVPLVRGSDAEALSAEQADLSASAAAAQAQGKNDDEAIGMWSELLPRFSNRSVSSVKSQVYLLPDFVGDLARSPFHTIVQNCAPSVFESRIMVRAVQYKCERSTFPIIDSRWAAQRDDSGVALSPILLGPIRVF